MLRGVTIALLLAAPAASVAQAPLDVQDPTPRAVQVQLETSGLGSVGQTFSTPFPASWAVNGNVGTLTISAATHEAMLDGGFPPPVPGAFDPIVIEIDRTTLEATSQPASGAFASPPVSTAFTQNALDTTALAGFMGPDVDPFFCTSQLDVDQACMFAPQFCGQVCTVVPGSPFDTQTGRVNLVGSVSETACDGALCFGPFDFFSGRGDLRFSEAPPAPAVPLLPGWGTSLLAGLLGGIGSLSVRRRATQSR